MLLPQQVEGSASKNNEKLKSYGLLKTRPVPIALSVNQKSRANNYATSSSEKGIGFGKTDSKFSADREASI